MRNRLAVFGLAVVAMVPGATGQAAATGLAVQSPVDFGNVALNTTATASIVVTLDSGYSLDLASGAGINGAPGPQGLAGPNGKVELVTCGSVTASPGHKHGATHSKAMRCTTKLVSGTVKFTSTGAVSRAVLSRAGVVEASGVASGRGGSTMLLSSRRLKAGRYKLALTGPDGRKVHTVILG
jgi:hypothetical protein